MYKRIIIFLTLFFLPKLPAFAAVFTPNQPIIPVSELKPGMNGYFLTVLKGTAHSKIPVRIVSILPQKPGKYFRELILVKITDKTKLAQGMSGSPVYISGKLAGAVRSGWEDTGQSLAVVMPIQSMCTLHDLDIPPGKPLNAVSVSGMSINTSAMRELSRKLGVNFSEGISSSAPHNIGAPSLQPGDSIASLLVWGDVELSALGTLTATDNHGRFLAFGHDFLKRGKSAYPSAGAYIHEVIDSEKFPFKIASTTGINGTVTQDRETGLSGKFGIYPQSISCEFVFTDLDMNTSDKYKFRTVADEFLSSALIGEVCESLCEQAWNRKGQGTMSVSIRIDGRAVQNGWTRKDIFFSDENIMTEAFKQVKTIISAYMTQPFSDIMPSGFRITAEATQFPKVLMIEDIQAPEDAMPGQEIEVSVKMRAWRTQSVTKKFTLKIPDDTSGVVELIVRGGGTQSFPQAAIEGGLKSVDSLSRMLEEFRAADANNQLILELNADRTADFLKKIKSGKTSNPGKKEKPDADFLPEEQEYLSQTKERRIKEGTLRIYSSDYYIDGLMRRIIHTEK